MKFVIDKLGFEEFENRWKATYEAMLQSGATKLGMEVSEYPDAPALIMPTKSGNGASGSVLHGDKLTQGFGQTRSRSQTSADNHFESDFA